MKIQVFKFKDQIGFIQPFMIRAASHVATERGSTELYKRKGLGRQRRGGERTLLAKYALFRPACPPKRYGRVCPVEHLTGAEQVIMCWLVKGYLPG